MQKQVKQTLNDFKILSKSEMSKVVGGLTDTGYYPYWHPTAKIYINSKAEEDAYYASVKP